MSLVLIVCAAAGACMSGARRYRAFGADDTCCPPGWSCVPMMGGGGGEGGPLAGVFDDELDKPGPLEMDEIDMMSEDDDAVEISDDELMRLGQRRARRKTKTNAKAKAKGKGKSKKTKKTKK
jgi:hypothetical protein